MRFYSSTIIGLAAVATLATLGFIPRTASAQNIFADNFNAESGGLNYTNFANWNVTDGSVDVVSFYGSQSVDMDGSTGNAGVLTTKNAFALSAGQYTFSFDLGKNGGSLENMTVSVGNVFTQQITDALTYPVLVNQSFNFTVGADTNASIVFDHAGGDNAGYVIDNVSLVRQNAGAAAPEPGSIALLLTAGVPVVGIIRRRKKH